MDMAEIGANIRSCRTEKDMTMEELGKAIGKSQSAVADYEKGRVDIPASSLIKIAEVLEVHPAKLFGMQTADEQFKPDATLRIFSAEDRRIIAGILVMNGYTTRHIKVAREGKKSSWYCIQAMLEESNLGSQYEANMEKAKFTVYGEPKGKGRPRFNTKTGHAITPKDTVSYENLVKLEWQTAYGTESFPKEAMLDMRIKAYYRIPKSASKKKRAAMLAGEIRPTKKPDMDNVVKIIADSLNNLAYYDDTQIVDCQCRKFYSENPRVEVTIINLSKEE